MTPDEYMTALDETAVEGARRLTEAIRGAAEATWELLAEAHARRVWTVLGYSSWGDYVSTEFGMSRRRGYQLIRHADVLAELEAVTGVNSCAQIPEGHTRDLTPDDVAEVVAEVLTLDPDDRAEELPAAVRRHAVANRTADDDYSEPDTEVGDPAAEMRSLRAAVRVSRERAAAVLDACCRARIAGVSAESIGPVVGLTGGGVVKAIHRHEREGSASSRRLARRAIDALASGRGKAWP